MGVLLIDLCMGTRSHIIVPARDTRSREGTPWIGSPGKEGKEDSVAVRVPLMLRGPAPEQGPQIGELGVCPATGRGPQECELGVCPATGRGPQELETSGISLELEPDGLNLSGLSQGWSVRTLSSLLLFLTTTMGRRKRKKETAG